MIEAALGRAGKNGKRKKKEREERGREKKGKERQASLPGQWLSEMKVVVQRVLEASVAVDGRELGRIGKGLLLLVGISGQDDEKTADRMADKICKLRIFEDENGKTNLSLADVGGGLLVISQFTLYADCHKGNRPSFIQAGQPDMAQALYEYMLGRFKERVPVVEQGSFGADMKVSLINDGPFTLALDSGELFR